MALVVLRGAVNGELAGHVTSEAIVAMIAFAAFGYVAGWITDYLVRDSIERSFRARVEWYRSGMTDAATKSTESRGE
ncbi:hypothetical protein Poly51_22380 [Rubripirellula tenax]|uniref:Uncharacterized protein n=2 Tax=Rubripirellula tenax TaxID=2528015 RepID=A0A5C6FG28_9BACT|nr:hypothetical protein Poly51_22380 [Rubripirellula tenax]